MDPYYIFPKEMWNMIFNLVENPEDKLNLIRSHPDLYDQFRAKETELLFYLALPIMLDNLESSGSQMCNQRGRNQRQIFQTCRLASSTACKVADKWMESYWKKSTGDHQPPSFLQDARQEGGLSYFGRPALDKFLVDFQNHPCEVRTPLLSRFATISISMWETEVTEALFRGEFDRVQAQEVEDNEKRIAVFTKLGPHLKKLQIHFGVEFMLNQGIWLAKLNSLRNVVQLSPNLKSLILEFPTMLAGPHLENNEEFSLPGLPQLEHLIIDGNDKCVPQVILGSIPQYFPRLKELEFKDVVNFQEEYLAEGQFPELKLLKVSTQSSGSGFYEAVRNFKKITKSIGAPNLVRIEFEFDLILATWPDSPPMEWDEVKRIELMCLSNLNKLYQRSGPKYLWRANTVFINENTYGIKTVFDRNTD